METPKTIEDNLKEKRFSEDRREQRRFSIFIKYLLFIDDIEYKGLVENLSLGGAYLGTIEPPITDDKLFKGGEIELKVSDNPIRVHCNIVHMAKQSGYSPGVGIAFSDHDEDAIAAIKEFIISLFT